MFCPSGSAVIATDTANPTTMPLTGINWNNPILRTDSDVPVNISFNGAGISVLSYPGEKFFRIPTGTTSLNITVTGSNKSASVAIGEEI